MSNEMFTVVKGKTYRATVALSGFEAWASNDQVAEKFTELGFIHVHVTGSGDTRHVRGTWTDADTTVEMPKQVTHAEEVASSPVVEDNKPETAPETFMDEGP